MMITVRTYEFCQNKGTGNEIKSFLSSFMYNFPEYMEANQREIPCDKISNHMPIYVSF